MLELSPHLWNWYVTFFASMGGVLAMTISLGIGLLTVDWCYLYAKRIEQRPTPRAFSGAKLNLFRFHGLVVGVFLAPVFSIVSYGVLFLSVMKLAPQPVDAPPLDFGSSGFDDQIGASALLLLYLAAMAVLFMGVVFYGLYLSAHKSEASVKPRGLLMRFLRRYFRDNLFIGVLLVLLACPAAVYFLYDVALLILVVVPSTRRAMTQIAFPEAGKFYATLTSLLGTWLIVVLFIPTAILLLRGQLLRWRYIIENPGMSRIFMRDEMGGCRFPRVRRLPGDTLRVRGGPSAGHFGRREVTVSVELAIFTRRYRGGAGDAGSVAESPHYLYECGAGWRADRPGGLSHWWRR